MNNYDIGTGKDFSDRCIGFDFFSFDPKKLLNVPFYVFPPKNVLTMVAKHLWQFYQQHEWMLIFHSFGEIPPAIAPLLKLNITKFNLDPASTVVPAEKQLKIGDELHWGFLNRKPAQTVVIIHTI